FLQPQRLPDPRGARRRPEPVPSPARGRRHRPRRGPGRPRGCPCRHGRGRRGRSPRRTRPPGPGGPGHLRRRTRRPRRRGDPGGRRTCRHHQTHRQRVGDHPLRQRTGARTVPLPEPGTETAGAVVVRPEGDFTVTTHEDRSPSPPPALKEDLDVSRALAAGLAAGPRIADTTVAATSSDQRSTAQVVARAAGTVSGLPLAERPFWLVADEALQVVRSAEDGDAVERGDVLMSVTARTRDLLTAERTALNLLTHMSGIATATRTWVDAVSGTGARIRDSRKTRPGLRALDKYAVRCGGGVNHRYCLSDAGLIKDNHVVAAGGVGAAVRAIRERFPELPLEVEVDRIDQIEEA